MTGESIPYDPNFIVAENERLTSALQAAGVGTWDYNLLTGQAQWSAICKQLFGLPVDAQVTAQNLLDQVHPDDRERVDQANNQALDPTGTGQHHIIFRTLCPGGTVRWVEAKGKTVRSIQGQLTRFSGIVQDVTQYVLSQQRIEESQQQLLTSFEDSPVGIALLSGEEFTFTMVNPIYARLTGRSPSELIGQPLLVAVPELTGQGFDASLRQVMSIGEPFVGKETPVQIRHGDHLETIYLDYTYQPQRDLAGKIRSVLVVAVDVTQQVLTRRAIEHSEARFRSLIEEAPVPAALLIGRDLVIEFANQPQLAVWAKGDNVRGKTLAQLLPEMEGQPFLQILDEVFTTGIAYQITNSPAELIVEGIRGTYYFDFTFKPLRNTQDQVYAILAMGVDVTQQVVSRHAIEESEDRYRTLSIHLDEQVQLRTGQLQAYIHDLQRSNENLQQFAYIASHDLQEPLRKIQAFGDLLKKSIPNQISQEADYLDRIQGAASRMSVLIRDLLAFSRISTQRDHSGLVPLADILQAALIDLDMVIQETGATIILDPLPMVKGDAAQLGQLFQNLLSNALKFRQHDQPPVIKVTYEWVAGDDLPTDMLPNRTALAYHQINVTDNGIGFEEKYKHRIFQVFQRLHGKRQYAGTGIGLAICEKVTANHGGAIMATSQPGRGATFTVYLPE